MKAVVYHAPQDVRVEEFPDPSCGKEEMLVKVDACAVCGSDMKSFKVGNPRLQPPVVMGHEFTGKIIEKGELVENFSLGDRIVMATSISCGACRYCKEGYTNLCVELAPMGFAYNGGMAQLVSIPARAIRNGHVLKVPPTVKAEHAALAEPLSCAVNSIQTSNMQKGDVVLIIGAGPMGILNAVVAKAMGASKVFMAEINPERLKQCTEFGFTRLINPSEEDLKAIILAETEGYGADVVVVAAPAAKPQEDAVELVRKRGTVCLFASLPAGQSNLVYNSRLIHYNEINVTGSSDSTAEHVAKAVELLAMPNFPGDRLASHILSLDNIHDAFDLMKSGKALRVVLKP